MVVRFSAFLYRPLAPSVLFASLACLLLLLLHLLLRSRRTVAHAADKLYSVSMRAARLVQFRVVLLVACCCLLSRMCCAVLSRHDTEHSEDNNLDDDEHSNLRSTRKLVRSDLDPEPDVWIVELQPGSTTTTTRGGIAGTASHLARFGGGQVGFVYGAALNGFVYHGSNIEGLLQNPNVRSITRDSIVTATAGGQVLPTGVMRIFADTKNSSVQASASCFCDAVVAVMDTGVDFTHPDLRVNTSMSIDCTRGTEDKPKCVRGEGNDDHGHGTHVSGTIAAVRNDRGVVGVCPGAEIWSIKVLDSTASGYWSWFLKGLDWVLTSGSNVDVINMSLGSYGCSTSICQAISMAKQAGIGVVVSAGNDDAPASLYTPACCPDVLTVSALSDSDGLPGSKGPKTCRDTRDDTIADFSNYGDAVDIAAPGDCILSTYKNGGYAILSGTSMAAPHVAGALLVMASNNHTVAPAKWYKRLKRSGNRRYKDKPNDPYKEALLDLRKIVDAKMVGAC